jgi:hypothetical protein
MSLEHGVCAIVASKKDGLKYVLGMGILVAKREVVTCAHVITAALGADWQSAAKPAVSVFFPFAPTTSCSGVVDKVRHAPEDSASDKISDIAVIVLDRDAPAAVGLATLREHIVDAPVKLFGFPRQELSDGTWKSHPKGRNVDGTLTGDLPGGRVQFNGRRTSGGVKKGYSGAATYDPERACVVGMIVELDTDGSNTGEVISVPSLATVGIKPASSSFSARPDAKRTIRQATLDQARAKKNEIEVYLHKVTDLLPSPAPGSRFLNLLKNILNATDAPGPLLRSAFGLPEDPTLLSALVTVVSSSEESMLPMHSVMAERLDQLLARLWYTLLEIKDDWQPAALANVASLRTLFEKFVRIREPTLLDLAAALEHEKDLTRFSLPGPDPTLRAVLLALEDEANSRLSVDPEIVNAARDRALKYLYDYLGRLISGKDQIEDSSNAWWGVRSGIDKKDDRFWKLLPDVAAKFRETRVPDEKVARLAILPEIYQPIITASYTLSNIQAIFEVNRGQLDQALKSRLNALIHDMLDRLLKEPRSNQLYLASVHQEGLRNYLDYVALEKLKIVRS